MRTWVAVVVTVVLAAGAYAQDPPCLTPFGFNNNCQFIPGAPLIADSTSSARFLPGGATHSIDFDALSLSHDGSQCTGPTDVELNSGPHDFTINCNDHADSIVGASIGMPTGWDGGSVSFEMFIVSNDPVPTGVYYWDFVCGCVADGDVVSSSIYSVSDSIDDFVRIQLDITDEWTVRMGHTGLVTCAGTCEGGQMLFWQARLNAPETTATPCEDVGILNIKLRYNVSGAFDPIPTP